MMWSNSCCMLAMFLQSHLQAFQHQASSQLIRVTDAVAAGEFCVTTSPNCTTALLFMASACKANEAECSHTCVGHVSCQLAGAAVAVSLVSPHCLLHREGGLHCSGPNDLAVIKLAVGVAHLRVAAAAAVYE
jgi:hypothetical protein